MPDPSGRLSQEQRVQADFAATMSQFRPYLSGIAEGPVGLDALTEALLRFGSCELNMRRADRFTALRVGKEESDALVKNALLHHERGLAALPAVRRFAEVLGTQPPDDRTHAAWRESSAAIRKEWRDHVRELDVVKDDAGHLVRIMDECCKAVDEGGLHGLGRHLSRQLDTLEEARRSPDRGTHAASFPWWKIVAAAVVVGMTAYDVWVLLQSGAPWWNFYLAALVASLMMLAVALGC